VGQGDASRLKIRVRHALAPYDYTSYTYSAVELQAYFGRGVVDDVRDSRGVHRSEG
jgi:hypothetical protein